MPNPSERASYLDPSLHSEEYYRDLRRKNVLRLVLTYLAPLIILFAYFYFQYLSLLAESTRNHLRTVAENYAKTIDLFLQERMVNLTNLIDDPKLRIPPAPAAMRDLLRKLSRASDTFEDVGFINEAGIQVAYEGPFPELQGQDYSREAWYEALRGKKDNVIVTDIHPGLRGKPHFTIAVSRIVEDRYLVLRATLNPEKFHEYLSSLSEMRGVEISVINPAGLYQLSAPRVGANLTRSQILPPTTPRLATMTARVGSQNVVYAYAWLRTCDWALIARLTEETAAAQSGSLQIHIIAFSAAVIVLIFSVIIIRAKKIVETIRQADTTRAHLSDNLLHASKLAAVGELASGIAHEINNPLAIINEEVGLIKDMTNPRFNLNVSPEDLMPHLDSIQGAVFRCRDITRKLLEFVRKSELTLRPHHVREVIDEVVNSFYGRESAVSNIEISRNHSRENPVILADKTQLEQVLLNLINNAIDAIEGHGKITITTSCPLENRVRIDIKDTGKGMTHEQLQKIFTPFYTTKLAGRGTGLGLSISDAIIRNMAGEISVVSAPGKGSTFSITLPVHKPSRSGAAG